MNTDSTINSGDSDEDAPLHSKSTASSPKHSAIQAEIERVEELLAAQPPESLKINLLERRPLKLRKDDLSAERLAEAKEELLVARNFLAQRRNAIRELTRDNFSVDEAAEFTVDSSFITTVAPVIARDAALVDLFNYNPSYLASQELTKAEDVRVAYAKNQLWPRVDLKASIGYNGLSRTIEMSYKNYWERSDPSWSAGVIINVPIFNKTGRSRLQEAKQRKAQALLELKRTEVTLLTAFDNAMRDIANATERVTLVKDSVRLAESALDAELRRLTSGMTTSFNVAQAQRDLSQARSRELATYVELNKAVTQLNFVLGTLDKSLRVSLSTE
jgi:outer membrane protein TolC